MNDAKRKFIDSLVDDLEKKEIGRMKREAKSKTAIFDIETASGKNDAVDQIRIENIRKTIMAEEYRWRYDYKESTNLKKKAEFEEKRAERIAREIQRMNEDNSLNPYFNRVIIISLIKTDGANYQWTELEYSEKEMVQKFFDAVQGYTVVGYNSIAFDMMTLKIKAAKYGISTGFFNHIDVMDKLKVWSPFGGKPLVVSQDILAAVLGIKPNKYRTDVDPTDFGLIFDQAKTMGDEEIAKKIDVICKYAMEDCRVLLEIYNKLRWIFI